MSNEYFFGDEYFDNSAFIEGLDAFEAAHNLQPRQPAPRPAPRPPSRPVPAPARTTTCLKSPLTEVITISNDDGYTSDV